MARMHSKKHGKAKSRKPILAEGALPENATMTKEAVEELIVNYAKQGIGPAQIGEKLKKEHNVLYPKQYLGRRLVQVLREKKLANPIPYDLLDLMKRAVNMRSHLSRNKQDKHNELRLRRTESKIWRLTKYYVGTGALPNGWKYDPKQAELLIKGKA